ncbi:MAG: hypothetical protein ACK5G7_05115 [Erysipelotrichaceae bacterium]
MRNEMFNRKLSFNDLLSTIGAYLNKRGIYYIIIMIITLTLSFFLTFLLVSSIAEAYQTVLIQHQEIVFRIVNDNPSETQIINVIDFGFRMIPHCYLSIIVCVFGLYMVGSIGNLLIFTSQDLFIKGIKQRNNKTLSYIIKRFFSNFFSVFIVGILVAVAILSCLLVLFLAQFMIDPSYIILAIMVSVAVIIFFRFLWIYKWQATYRYDISGGEACGYSIKMLFKNPVITLLFYLIFNGSIYLIIYFFGSYMISNLHWTQWALYSAIIYVVICLIYILSNLFVNFWFLNRDNVMRQKLDSEYIYKDYISHHFASANEKKSLYGEADEIVEPKVEAQVTNVTSEPKEIIEPKETLTTKVGKTGMLAGLISSIKANFNKPKNKTTKKIELATYEVSSKTIMRYYNNMRPNFTKGQFTHRNKVKAKHYKNK